MDDAPSRYGQEDDLIHWAQLGSQEAFRQLVECYHALVWCTARVLLGDSDGTNDVEQEVWLNVWRGLPGFKPGHPFRPWLLAIVRNCCRRAIQKRRPSDVVLDEDLVYGLPSSDDVPTDMLKQMRDPELTAALAELSANHRTVIELRYYADLELAEISAITDTPLNTVKTRLHCALNKLRARLSEPPPEEHCVERRA